MLVHYLTGQHYPLSGAKHVVKRVIRNEQHTLYLGHCKGSTPKGIVSVLFIVEFYVSRRDRSLVSRILAYPPRKSKILSEGARGIKASLVFVSLRRPRGRDLLYIPEWNVLISAESHFSLFEGAVPRPFGT
jgi:hypothetical protein